MDIDNETTFCFTCRLEMLTGCSEGAATSRCSLLKLIVDMSSQLLRLYKDLPSFPEVFSPLDANLARSVGNWHSLFYNNN